MMLDDRLGRRFQARLDELADPRLPEYVHDVLAATARMRQRPVWQFPGRWIAMELHPTRVVVAPFPWRPLVLLALLVLAGAALVLAVPGSRPRLPEPFGPAANGMIAFASDGDILVIEGEDGMPRVLVGGPPDDGAPVFSPDGTRLMFTRTVRHNPFLMVVASDGGDPIAVLPEPLIEPTAFAWSPDSRYIAIASMVRASPRITIAAADGSGADVLELGMIVDSPAWRPPDGRELLVRGRNADGWDLHRVEVGGGAAHPLGLARTEANRRDTFFAGLRLRNASWSPDGERIAYEDIDDVPSATGEDPPFSPGGMARLIHVASADGTDDRAVDASSPDFQQLTPRWSPDGSRLLFAQRRSAPNRPADEWWWSVIGADGGRVVDLGSRVTNLEGTADWAPDGTRVISVVGRPWEDPPIEQVVRLFDPLSGEESEATWTSTDQPAWQRLAP